MSQEQAEASIAAIAAPKAAKKTQYSKTGKMVMDAIVNLDEKKGSSMMKIRGYISKKNPGLDVHRYHALIKKFLTSSVEKGELKVTEKGTLGKKNNMKKCASIT